MPAECLAKRPALEEWMGIHGTTGSSLPLLPDLFITDTSADQEVISWFEMICESALIESSKSHASAEVIPASQAPRLSQLN